MRYLHTLSLASLVLVSGTAAAQQYTASWASVDQHTPAPEWFQDAKFGIYYHWGAFCVAEYGSEWYPRNMYNRPNAGEYKHQLQVYGDPFADWPYQNFITGANDKSGKLAVFAPQLVSSGGKWDPDAWAQLFADSGARFAGPVTEHHDGYSMWDSKINPWNSVAYGPKLNLAKLQADAIRKKGLKLLMSQHTAYNFTGYYQYAPPETDPKLQQLFGQLPKAQEESIWLAKLKEIIDEFLPDIIWQDFNLGQISEATRLQFLSYYYNAAASKNVEVVATYKDGFDNKGEVFDYERGGAGDITTPYWLTDDAISPSSWSYTAGMTYYSATAEVHTFIDHVSKGGNLLLNISPLPDGTIPQQQKDLLNAFGTFLKQNGEAIYDTRPWMIYGEGPTKIGGGSFTGPKTLTASDIRYTKSKDGDAVYAIIGAWPGAMVNMASVTTGRFAIGSGKVFLFGPVGDSATSLQFTQDATGLHVVLPATAPYQAIAYALKISKSGAAPATTPSLDGGVPPNQGDASAPTRDASATDPGGGSSGGRGSNGSDGGARDGSDATGAIGGSGSSGISASGGGYGDNGGPGSTGTTGGISTGDGRGSNGNEGATNGAAASSSSGGSGHLPEGGALGNSGGNGALGSAESDAGCSCAVIGSADRASRGRHEAIAGLLTAFALGLIRLRRRRTSN